MDTERYLKELNRFMILHSRALEYFIRAGEGADTIKAIGSALAPEGYVVIRKKQYTRLLRDQYFVDDLDNYLYYEGV